MIRMIRRIGTVRWICLCLLGIGVTACSPSSTPNGPTSGTATSSASREGNTSPDSASSAASQTSSHNTPSSPRASGASAGNAVTGTTNDASTTVVNLEGLENQRYRPHLQAEIEHVSPPSEWASEAFSEAASAQLKKLAGWLRAADATTEGLAPLVDASATSEPLLPEMVTVLHDETVNVQRWQGPSAADSGNADQDSASQPKQSLVEALGLLRAQFPSSQAPRWEFKIVEVQWNAETQRATTHLYVEGFSRSDNRASQYNAEWTCDWVVAGSEPPRLQSIRLRALNEVKTHDDNWRFQDVTEQIFAGDSMFDAQLRPGVDYWRRRLDWRFGMDVVGAHGMALGDANGDGLEDLYLCEPGGLPNRLLLQQVDGTVRDVSHDAKVDFLEPTHSALFVDLDNDGDQDLTLASGRYLLFLENDGRAHFQLRKIQESLSVFRSLAAADFNGDRLVDLYACGYFLRDGSKDGVGLGRPMPYHDANNGAPNYLFANQGDWRFADVTKQVGLDENNTRFSYACAWADYDEDGDVDLYVANDFGRNNLYRHDRDAKGQSHFHDVADAAGVEDISAGMSVSWSDYDRDGRFDIYVGNMYSSAGNRVAYQRQYLPGGDDAERALYQRHARGNSLFQNAGDGTFRDVTLDAGVNMARWAWSSNFVDLNNDGWDDMVVANGMVTGQEDPGDL